MAVLSVLPFIFTYRDAVYGNGFLAEVVTRGRALAREEEKGCWWLYGVNPGDIAAGGGAPSEVHAEFRKSFTGVLFELAEGAKDFADFKAQVTAFFSTVNAPALVEWQEAVAHVRASGMAKKTTMPVESADAGPNITVTLKQQKNFSTADNILESEPALAA